MTGEQRTELPNGSTVTLRELFARFEGLRELIDERDRRYAESMQAAEDAVAMSFKSSEKAIEKADAARTVHDQAVNEWRNQYNEQEKKFLPKAEYDGKMRDLGIEMNRLAGDMQAFPSKTEVSGKFSVHDSRFDATEKRIAALETARAEDLGRKAQSAGDKGQSNVQIGWLMGGVGLIVSVASIGIGLALALSGR